MEVSSEAVFGLGAKAGYEQPQSGLPVVVLGWCGSELSIAAFI
jgi:hypothetical protein